MGEKRILIGGVGVSHEFTKIRGEYELAQHKQLLQGTPRNSKELQGTHQYYIISLIERIFVLHYSKERCSQRSCYTRFLTVLPLSTGLWHYISNSDGTQGGTTVLTFVGTAQAPNNSIIDNTIDTLSVLSTFIQLISSYIVLLLYKSAVLTEVLDLLSIGSYLCDYSTDGFLLYCYHGL